jgi:hypothetical protein
MKHNCKINACLPAFGFCWFQSIELRLSFIISFCHHQIKSKEKGTREKRTVADGRRREAIRCVGPPSPVCYKWASWIGGTCFCFCYKMSPVCYKWAPSAIRWVIGLFCFCLSLSMFLFLDVCMDHIDVWSASTVRFGFGLLAHRFTQDHRACACDSLPDMANQYCAYAEIFTFLK